MWKKATVFVALALSAAPAAAVPIQWEVGSGGNGHYYELITNPLRFDDALSAAAASTYNGLSGYLATITSAAEQSFLNTVVNPSRTAAWLGGSDAADEGIWRWVAGPEANQTIASSYSNWASGEPNNYSGGEDALQGWWTSGGAWNDFGGNNRLAYVVEFSEAIAPVPLPAGLPMLLLGLGALGLATRRKAA